MGYFRLIHIHDTPPSLTPGNSLSNLLLKLLSGNATLEIVSPRRNTYIAASPGVTAYCSPAQTHSLTTISCWAARYPAKPSTARRLPSTYPLSISFLAYRPVPALPYSIPSRSLIDFLSSLGVGYSHSNVALAVPLYST